MGIRRASVRVPLALRRAARREFSVALGARGANGVIVLADAGFGQLATQIPQTNYGARHLLRMSAYSVALFRALIAQGFESESATELVSNAVFSAIRPGRDAMDRLGRIRHRARLRGARWASDLARRLYYAEPGWRMQAVLVDDGFGMDVSRCMVAEYFDRLGESELCQRVICDQDVRSAARHGITLERSGTLAGGADRCDFRYHVPSTNPEPKAGWLSVREITDTVRIEASPEKVWSWLTAMADHYTEWHPDHAVARWERGTPNEVGSVLLAVEYLGGHREALRFELTEITPPHTFRYRMLGLHGVLLPGGCFTITPDHGGSLVTASIQYRFGALTRRLFTGRIALLQAHMREEGRSLKQLVESAHRFTKGIRTPRG